MKPLSLTVSNFRSFTDPQTFYFPDAPGLYFMRGENKAETRLEANGSGKSSVWDALCWVLFGKTTRGLRAGDVANWDAGKNAIVVFKYEAEDEIWSLRRSWKPNSWTLESNAGLVELAEDENNLALSHLNSTMLPFLHSVLMAQQQPMFLDLPAPAKSSLFSEVLELDVWSDYSARASKKVATLNPELNRIQTKLAVALSQLDTLTRTNYAEDSAEWERKQAAALKEREDTYLEYVDKASREAKDLANAEQALSKLPDTKELTESLEALRKSEKTTERRLIDEVEIPRTKLESELKVAIRVASRLKEGGATCPTCGQEFPNDNWEKEFQSAQKEVSRIKASLPVFGELEERLRSDLAKFKDTYERRSKQAQDALKGRDLGIAQVNAFKRALALSERELDHIEDEVERISQQTNPFLALQDKQSYEIAMLQTQLDALHREQRILEERILLASYWVIGFKDIRLQLIEESLTQLELEVNSALTSLGLVGWELRFEVDKETKSGSIKQGFNVQVVSPHNKQPVPWESWSGGESQRLRLATTLGLSNLIRSRSGIALEVEVWDEPTQYMSGQGVNDLLEALESRAQAEQRQIWIVDHRSLGFGGFSGEVVVTKTTKGSVIGEVQ